MAPPPAPKGITVWNTPDGFEVQWRPVAGATEYRTVISSGATTTYGPWGADTFGFVDGLTAGTLYSVGAQARNALLENSTVSTDSNWEWRPDGPFLFTRRGRWSGGAPAAGAVSYDFDDLTAGQDYWFQVRVFDEQGYSEWVTFGPISPAGGSFRGQLWPRGKWPGGSVPAKSVGQLWPRGDW